MRKENFIGFADVYLQRCNKESKTGDKVDVELYARLVELDTKLGTGSSEQLFVCLFYTTRWDIIKVSFNTRDRGISIILDYQFQKRQRI